MTGPAERPALTPEQLARVSVARQLAEAHGQGREALAVYLEASDPANPWPLAASALARTARQLLEIIDGLAGREDQELAEAGQLAQVRALLAAFDWSVDDRQYALEAIERIVTGGTS
jgi:hypothetical protein